MVHEPKTRAVRNGRVNYSVRIPQPLYDALAEIARRESRSVHGHILFLIGEDARARGLDVPGESKVPAHAEAR